MATNHLIALLASLSLKRVKGNRYEQRPVILDVHIEAVPGREHEVEEGLHALLEPTRREPGCLTYLLHRDPAHPGNFLFYEQFENEEALGLHVNSEHYQKWATYRAKHGDPIASAVITKWLAVT